MKQEKIEYYIKAYGTDLYSFCMFLTKNRQDADDLYQDTFLRAMEKGEIREDENPKSYLISIAINLWNNKTRKFLWRKRKADFVESIEETDLEQIADGSIPIELKVIRNEEFLEIRRQVAMLPEKMRLVILMYYMEELSVEEISGILHVPKGTVKSRLYHARARLKEEMEGQFYERTV